MDSDTDDHSPERLQGWSRVHNEYCKLCEDPTDERPYKEAAILTPSDASSLRIAIDIHANTGFWALPDTHTQCAVEGAVEETLNVLETILNETNESKTELCQRECPTIGNAHNASDGYMRILETIVSDSLFHNERLFDLSSDNLFQSLQCVPFHRGLGDAKLT